MTPAGRIALGAALGAVLTLITHPTSRPYVLGVFNARAESTRARTVDPTTAPLPPPTDMLTASQWLQQAAERSAAAKPLEASELTSIERIAAAASKHEPDNAFPYQLRAALLARAGRKEEAEALWLRASRCASWNDYQSSRLLVAQARIAQEVGTSQAWQLGLVYHDRSEAPARIIAEYARSLVRQVDTKSLPALKLRYATLLNGLRLRKGSRCLRVGKYGTDIIELSSYPPDLANDRNPRKLYVARHTFLNGLREANMQDEAAIADLAFRDNDGWRALTGESEAQETVLNLCLASILTSSGLSATLLLSFIGGVFWLTGSLLDRTLGSRERIQPLPATACSVAIGGGVYALTGAPLTALACSVCILLLTVGPRRGRRLPPNDLGPLFSFTLAALALAFAATTGAFLLGTTWAAEWLLPSLGVPPEYYGGSTLLVGLSGLILALVLLTAPMWGTALRVPSPYVLSLALRRFGTYIGCGALFISVLLGPFAIYADNRIAARLYRLVANEPVVYLPPEVAED